jgi:hypothetical protein
MGRFVLVVLNEPKTGREDEFNEWYETTHLPDVLGVPGIVSAQRFEFVDVQGGPPSEHRYLVLFEVEAPDVEAAQDAFRDAHDRWSTEPERHRSDSGADFRAWYFRPIRKRITSGE